MQRLLVFFRDDFLQLDHSKVTAGLEFVQFVQHEGHAPGHPRCEVAPGPTEHDDDAARHVLAAMVAGPFDDRSDAAVAHREPFTCHAVEIGFALRPAIERSVSDENRLFRRIDRLLRREYNDLPAGQSLAQIVV